MSEIINKCEDDRYNEITGGRASDIAMCRTEEGTEELWARKYGPNAHLYENRRTPALTLGTDAHDSLLLDRTSFVVCDMDKRTKAYKEFAAEHEGQRFEKTDYALQVDCIKDAGERLLVSEFGESWREDALVECAFVWDWQGHQMKCKDDLLVGSVLVDVKTLSSFPAGGRFLSHIDRWGYDIKAAHYISGNLNCNQDVGKYLWLFIESKFPYRARFVEFTKEMRDNTWSRLEKCYEQYVDLENFVPPTHVELDLEQWWMYRYETEVALEGAEEWE